MNDQCLEFSVVVPFYNEAGSAPALIGEIVEVMGQIGQSWEGIFVNDGSRDLTGQELSKVASQNPCLVVINHEKNQGQASALYTGLKAARGRMIITMDGDGQNVPADIPKLLAAKRETNVSMIVGIRHERNDHWLRRRISRWANAVRSRVLRDGVRDSGCALKVFDREVISALIPIRTLYSFIPAMAVSSGFKVGQLNVQHRARESGTSNYNLRIFLWRPVLDMLGMWWYINRSFVLNHRKTTTRNPDS